MQVDVVNSLSWYASEILRDPVLLVALSGWLFAFVIALLLSRVAKARDREDSFRRERLDGLVGRLDRIERLVSDVRNDVLRATQALKSDLSKSASREGVAPVVDREEESNTGSESSSSESSGSEDDDPASGDLSSLDQEDTSAEIVSADDSDAESAVVVGTIAPDTTSSQKRSLNSKLASTRRGFLDRIRSVFSSKPKLDQDMIEELEALMIGSDVGVKTTGALIDELKEDLKNGRDVEISNVVTALKGKMLRILDDENSEVSSFVPKRTESGPKIILVVGVNGVGKTTTTAKLANQWARSGASVLMVAADTFRAAAVEQLKSWGSKLGIPVVHGAENAKPQTVVFEAMVRAQNEPVDVVIIDTAGRLHTKQNLMDELAGVRNSISRHFSYAPDEVWLVVDGATGQNAINQAQEFNSATKLTGVVVTKLDGTPKGGVVVAIKDEFGIPIKYIGVGEAEEDLRPFIAEDFVEALFSSEEVEQPRNASANAETRRRRREAVGA